MSADQFGTTGLLFFVLSLFLFFAGDQSRSYTTKETCGFIAWVCVALSVISFLLAIWGQGWLYG